MTVRATNRWQGVSAIALVAGGIGMLAGRPGILLAGAVGVVFAAYARAEEVPRADLVLERTVSETEPDEGGEIEVTVTIENRGGTLPDLRVIDGVPPGLDVASGSPRRGTALRPGKVLTYSYTVTARRGIHAFEPATALLRTASGSHERETRLEAETATTVRCVPALVASETIPLRALTTPYVGRVGTDAGGEGVEFYATREYRPGDSPTRIDWNRYARTGRLATLEFRRERAASVVLVVDVREPAYRADPEGVPAPEHAIAGARAVAATLFDAGDRIGVASLGPEFTWLAPAAGREHRAQVREALATEPAFAPTPPSAEFFPRVQLRYLRRRLAGDAQIVAFTPLCDDLAVGLCRHLDAFGHPVTVVSPDVTSDGEPAERLAGELRRIRCERLRANGIRVVDWTPREPLGAAIARTAARWSR